MPDPAPTVEVLIDRTGRFPVARVSGTLDFLSAARLRELLRDLIRAPAARVVLELSALDHIDSSGVGTLVAMQREVATARGALVLAAPSTRVRGVLEISRLDGYFTIFPSAAEALRP